MMMQTVLFYKFVEIENKMVFKKCKLRVKPKICFLQNFFNKICSESSPKAELEGVRIVKNSPVTL